MSSLNSRVDTPSGSTFLPLVAACLIAAQVIAGQTAELTLTVVAGFLMVLVSFFHSRIAVYFIIFSMLLSPELGVGLQAGSRAATVRLEDLLLLLVGFSWLARAAYYKELNTIRRGPLNVPIVAYSLAALVATLVGGWIQPINWLQALLFLAKYIEYFVLYYLVLVNIRNREDIRRYLFAAFLTAAIVSVVGIAQIPGGDRVSAPFEGETGEPNTFGGYLVFMMSIAGGFLLNAESTRERVGWSILIASMGLPLLYTLSRGSWLAAVAATVVLISRAPRRGPLLAAAAGLLALTPLLLPRQVIERMEYTFNQPEEPGQIQIGETRLDTSFSERLRSWSYGLKGWSQRPLTGYGVSGFGFMDAQYVRILTETGLVGLVAFLWLVSRLTRLARERHQNASDPFARGLCLGYLAGLVALLVHGLGANTFIIVRIMEPFWLMTALVVALPTDDPNVSRAEVTSA